MLQIRGAEHIISLYFTLQFKEINRDDGSMPTWQNYIEKYRTDHRVPMVVAIFFAAGLLIALWQFIHDFSHHVIKSANIVMRPTPSLPNIADLHLFGIYNESTTDLPITQLQLSLVGTIVMMHAPNESRALIAAPSGPTKVYQVGSTVPGNATVSHIEKNYVVLNSNGGLQKLMLPIEKLSPEE